VDDGSQPSFFGRGGVAHQQPAGSFAAAAAETFRKDFGQTASRQDAEAWAKATKEEIAEPWLAQRCGSDGRGAQQGGLDNHSSSTKADTSLVVSPAFSGGWGAAR